MTKSYRQLRRMQISTPTTATRFRLPIAGVVAVLVLAGCSSGNDESSVGVGPIGPILAVDSDMQGGAHDVHGPLLTNLQPDTEYQYILQGSDTAGTIYRSEQLTFRTPAAIDNGLGDNVAPTGTISAVSSEFSDSFGASNAIDGDVGTEWSSAGDGDDAWIEIDLGALREITAVAFRTRQMTDGTAITDSFTITLDRQTFGPFDNGPEAVMLDEPVTASVVRIDAVQTTGGNTGATEIEIYATN